MKQEDVLRLIPKNKFDSSTLNELMQISEDDVKIILPELLGWIADFNWPIAKNISQVLARFPNSLTPLIKNALSFTETDNMLKYWIIAELLPMLPESTQKALLTDIERICCYPTNEEEIEGVCEQAEALITKFK